MKTALVTGISGQDGYYLTNLLLSKDYKVIGIVSSDESFRKVSHNFISQKLELKVIDYKNKNALESVILETTPSELYNLVAASSVKDSFENPIQTSDLTAFTPLRILETIRTNNSLSKIKYFQASSSEMFGKSYSKLPYNEDSVFNPTSPYAISKLFAHQACQLYRKAYGIFASCGILFNHESPLRSEKFVSRKISKAVADISKGKIQKITLGDTSVRRDWGFAGDYVKAMWLMLQNDEPGDFVVATGTSHSVLEFVQEALTAAGISGHAQDFIASSDSFRRPAEIQDNYGDFSKSFRCLGWQPESSFQELVKMMVIADITENPIDSQRFNY